MTKEVIYKSEFEELSKAYAIGDKQFYYLRIFIKDLPNDLCECYTELVDHQPTLEEKGELYDIILSNLKKNKVDEIIDYDVSENVNSFLLNDTSSWLDKATRVGLMNSLTIEKAAGHTESTLYLNGYALVLPIDNALAMLTELELYAVACYQMTESHKASVNAMNVIEDVIAYDYTVGYPQHPVFNV